MAFEWPSFFRRHNIVFRDRGPNVSAGNIVIHCPWCGPRDPGEHLSVSVKGSGFYCYRDNRHRGKSPVSLITALLGVSVAEARNIVDGGGMDLPADFKARIRHMLGPPKVIERPGLKLLDSFREFRHSGGKQRVNELRFISYLINRGFHDPGRTSRLLAHFNIRYCLSGPFSERIIFPITQDGIIVNWTGRAISPNETLRYRTLSTDEEKSRQSNLPVAVGPITDYVLWFDECYESDAHTLVLTEGPFDAFKIWYLGYKKGIVATCLFTNDATASQMELIEMLAPRFKRVVLLLDQGAYHKAMALKTKRTFEPQAFPGLKLELVPIPSGVKDPGELRTLDFL